MAISTRVNAASSPVEPIFKSVYAVSDAMGPIGRETTINLDLVSKVEAHSKGHVKLSMKNGTHIVVKGEVWEYTGEDPPPAAPRRKRGWSMKKGDEAA